MNSNKTINMLSKIVILGFFAGIMHLFYFKFVANPYSPIPMHLLAQYSLKYFNTWVLIAPFIIIVFLLIKRIWNLLFKNASISNIKDKIQLYGSVLLSFIVGCSVLFYGGWIINHYFLPYKFHPLSLLADAGIVLFSILLSWLIWVIINAKRDSKFKGLIFRGYKITALVIVLFLIGLNSYVFIHSHNTPKRPNVIFILIDALRADHLSSYGYPRSTSPYIDSIARDGVLFTNTISSAPWTIPSIASIFTSVSPSVHEVIRNSSELGVLSDDFKTLAEILLESEYETAAFVSNPWLTESYKINQGFNTYKIIDSKEEETYDADELTSSVLSWLDKRSSNPFFLSWLDNRPTTPFFLYVHYMDVHGPYNKIPSPYDKLFLENTDIISNRKLTAAEIGKIPNYWEVKDLQKTDLNFYITLYDQEIRVADAEIKKVMDKLDRLDLMNNTIVIITADHGVEFLEHGDWDMGKNLHDENLHVPLIMKFPPKLPRDYSIENQVRSIDIMPTLLGLLNVTAPNNINGKDLTPLIYQKGQFNLDAFSEASERDPFNYIKSLRTEGFKIIYNTKTQNAELYDLVIDPKESVNIVQNKTYNSQFERAFNLLSSNIKTNDNLKQVYKNKTTLEINDEMKRKLRSLGYLQ